MFEEDGELSLTPKKVETHSKQPKKERKTSPQDKAKPKAPPTLQTKEMQQNLTQ